MAKDESAKHALQHPIAGAVGGLVRDLSANIAARIDSWQNALLGFGDSRRDKTMAGRYTPSRRLTDGEITAMYESDDFAARIVDIPAEEELRAGWSLDGDELTPEQKNDAKKWLERRWSLTALVGDARRWGRCYGGAKIWIGTEDGDLTAPLPEQGTLRISFLRVVDRRYIQPVQWYLSGPRAGAPEMYALTDDRGHTLQGSFWIHESRLIHFPGARTNAKTRAMLNGWDLSVLQRPFEALRSEATVWKSTEILASDANQGVYKIKNLFGMMAAGQKDKILERIQIMDLGRSVGRAILLDAEFEDFERKPTNFSGLKELNEQGQLRVAAAAEIPVTLLLGQAPAGLNATGDSDIKNFQNRNAARRQIELEPAMLRLIGIVLRDAESPLKLADDADIAICWAPSWTPTAAEKATIRLQRAQEASIYLDKGVLLPEEVALSIDQDEWQFNREARESILSDDAAVLEMLETAKAPEPPPGAVDDPESEGAADDEAAEDGARLPLSRSDADFNESDHPRDENGQFTEGTGAPVGAKARALAKARAVRETGSGRKILSRESRAKRASGSLQHALLQEARESVHLHQQILTSVRGTYAEERWTKLLNTHTKNLERRQRNYDKVVAKNVAALRDPNSPRHVLRKIPLIEAQRLKLQRSITDDDLARHAKAHGL